MGDVRSIVRSRLFDGRGVFMAYFSPRPSSGLTPRGISDCGWQKLWQAMLVGLAEK